MKRTDSFTDFVREQLSTLGSIRAKAMFGGHGFYQGETLFGMEYRGKVFFRVDDKTRPRYVARGMKAFSPSVGMASKNYFEVPLDVVENSTELSRWARDAVAAVPAKKPAPRKRSKSIFRI